MSFIQAILRARPTAMLLAAVLVTNPAAGAKKGSQDDDVAAARALFERNLQAIRDQGRSSALGTVRRRPELAGFAPWMHFSGCAG